MWSLGLIEEGIPSTTYCGFCPKRAIRKILCSLSVSRKENRWALTAVLTKTNLGEEKIFVIIFLLWWDRKDLNKVQCVQTLVSSFLWILVMVMDVPSTSTSIFNIFNFCNIHIHMHFQYSKKIGCQIQFHIQNSLFSGF